VTDVTTTTRPEELERLLPWGRPPRLILRFALYTSVGIALAAASMILFVRHFERGRAEQAATVHTKLVAELVGDELRSGDLAAPVTRTRRALLDTLIARRVLRETTVRIDLIDAHGIVTYSSDHTLIGTKDTDPADAHAAISGVTVSDVTRIDPPGTAPVRDALRTFAPLHVAGAPGGAISLSQNYAPIAAAAHRAYLPVVVVLELVLLGLYISLFPILRRVTRGLRRQMDVIEHQALHDALTDLPNRTLFRAMVEEALAGSDSTVALLIIELDRFKEINDTLGHSSGDELLRVLSLRLARAAEGEGVARLGGDEFGIVSRRATDPVAALALADRLRDAIGQPVEVAGVSLEMQASVGIALAPEHGTDVETLLRCADVAMYAAKAAHATQLYSSEHDTGSPARLALMSELRTALHGDELLVYYQPQVDLRSGRVCGVEALIRWRHPTRGFLSPDEFLPIAEQGGLMRQVTHAVFEQALAQARSWHNAGLDLTVAVNVSGRDLVDSRFAEDIGRWLAQYGVDPSRLQIEITEGTILSDRVRAEAVLTRLNTLGTTIAVDDFGTGYSSLGHLRQLPVDVLKIDKSFVLNMSTEPGDAAIVRTTIDLAHSLGLTTVAEGVETDEAARHLEALGCDVVQGYAISRPVPAVDLTAWLRSNGGRMSFGSDAEIRALPIPIVPVQAVAGSRGGA
jgi:diguanylate cyclase (GGDEF)-like protein